MNLLEQTILLEQVLDCPVPLQERHPDERVAHHSEIQPSPAPVRLVHD